MYLTIFGKPRYLGLLTGENEQEFERGERILIESSRGMEIAVVADEITERQEGLYRSIDNRQEGQSNGDSGLQGVTFLKKVGQPELESEDENRSDEETALVTARQILSHHDLNIKLVDVEYMLDRKKLFLYFTSEQRVDFRAYVRDLAREFRTRIELRQIGVRDEAKVVKGIGACGRVCCCSYWLHRFSPIGIKMVKEQNLALNPTKISGLCGRLMCCMSFEQENYRELWKKLPSHASKIKTEQGTWVLIGVDLASQSCLLHGPGGNVSVPVAKFAKFRETVLAGGVWSDDDAGPGAHGAENGAAGCDAFAGSCERCAISARRNGGCKNADSSPDAEVHDERKAPFQRGKGAGKLVPALSLSDETGVPHVADPRRRPPQRSQKDRGGKYRPEFRSRAVFRAEADVSESSESYDRRRQFRRRPAGRGQNDDAPEQPENVSQER